MAMLGLTIMVGCPDNNSEPTERLTNQPSESLRLQGQVWMEDRGDGFMGNNSLVHFDGSAALDVLGGTGEIADGMLDFTIGTLPADRLAAIGTVLAPPPESNERGPLENWAPITVSPAETRSAHLVLEGLRFNLSLRSDAQDESAEFIFVDRRVTISSAGNTFTTFIGTSEWKPFSITLESGWNVLHFVTDSEGTNRTLGVDVAELADIEHLRWVRVQRFCFCKIDGICICGTGCDCPELCTCAGGDDPNCTCDFGCDCHPYYCDCTGADDPNCACDFGCGCHPHYCDCADGDDPNCLCAPGECWCHGYTCPGCSDGQDSDCKCESIWGICTCNVICDCAPDAFFCSCFLSGDCNCH